MEYISHSEAETEAFGERLAAALSPGAVVAYRGGLGMKAGLRPGIASGLSPPSPGPASAAAAPDLRERFRS